jgi:vacuolar-type H+-ATPase subunit I/STV1
MPSTITSQIHLIQSLNDSDHRHCRQVKQVEVEKAQYAEKQAAVSYAVALSDGDDADEQRAEKVLRLASEALAMVTRGKRGLAATAQALKNEVEKLDVEIAEIREVLKDLRQRQLPVARIMWADRMDKAAQEFAAVAAHVEATEKALGWTSSLSELYVPLQTPYGAIRDKAYALSMEQLLAA